MKTTVRQLLAKKGSWVESIPEEASVYAAIEKMASKSIGALTVMRSNKLVGIVTERDYARKIILKGRSSRETKVGEIMTSDLIVASPDWTMRECLEVFTRARIRHLPVLENSSLCGIVSSGDAVKEIISMQDFVIAELTQYMQMAI